MRPGSSPHGRTRALSGARHVWFESGEDPLGLEVPISRVYGDVADDLSEAHIIASFYPPVRLVGQLMEAIAQHMPSLTSIVLDLQVFSVFVHHVVVLDLLGSSPLYYGYDGLVWNVTTNVSYGDTRYINFADLPRGDNSWQGYAFLPLRIDLQCMAGPGCSLVPRFRKRSSVLQSPAAGWSGGREPLGVQFRFQNWADPNLMAVVLDALLGITHVVEANVQSHWQEGERRTYAFHMNFDEDGQVGGHMAQHDDLLGAFEAVLNVSVDYPVRYFPLASIRHLPCMPIHVQTRMHAPASGQYMVHSEVQQGHGNWYLLSSRLHMGNQRLKQIARRLQQVLVPLSNASEGLRPVGSMSVAAPTPSGGEKDLPPDMQMMPRTRDDPGVGNEPSSFEVNLTDLVGGGVSY